MFYLFSERNSGCKALFDQQEAFDNFMKDYGIDMYNDSATFPIRNNDYSVTIFTKINPCFKSWNEEEYEEEYDEEDT